MMTGSGDLRHRVRFERRAAVSDGYGNTQGGFVELCTVWARVAPKSSRSEAVQAGRLAGEALYSIQVRSSAATRAITTSDRAVMVSDGPVPAGQIFNIRFAGDLTGRGELVTFDAERGVAT